VRQGSVLSPVLFDVYLDDLGELCSPMDSCYIILYADDILLIFSSVTYTERLLHRCKQELSWFDMNINFNKSCCLRIDPRCDIVREAVTSSCNRRLPWVSNMRYLGVHFVQSRTLKCSLDAAKRGFHRAANSIFGKIGRIASEEVVLQLIKSRLNVFLCFCMA